VLGSIACHHPETEVSYNPKKTTPILRTVVLRVSKRPSQEANLLLQHANRVASTGEVMEVVALRS
jgi:hypothetical protein